MASNNKISNFDGIAYAIGSIIGSGILFLPMMTVNIAGNNAIFSWMLGTLICLPILYIFKEILSCAPEVTSVDSFIGFVFGRKFSSILPYLFISTVTLGMPAAALIAGEYVGSAIGESSVGIIVSVLIIIIGMFANLKGVQLGSLINKIFVILFLVISLILIAGVFAKSGASIIVPEFSEFDIKNVGQATLITFWAFAGFENLTFIANQFKNGVTTFIISGTAALLICGAIYLLLTFAILSIGTNTLAHTDNNGLLHLANSLADSASLRLIVGLFAFSAVLVNQISWTKGICSMITENAGKGVFPKVLSSNNSDTSKLAVVVFSLVNIISLTFQYYMSGARNFSISAVSTNFVLIYILCMSGFILVTKSILKKVYAGVISFALVLFLLSSPITLLYPAIVALLAWLHAGNRQKESIK